MTDPFATFQDAMRDAGMTFKVTGDRLDGRCPAHDDAAPSLSVRNDPEAGTVLVNCHAGCPAEAVIEALNLAWTDLFRPRTTTTPEVVTAYDYTSEDGEVLFQKLRLPGKDFRARRPDGRGGWSYRLGDARRVLYRLHEVGPAIEAGRTILVVEGEKDSDRAATDLGMVATTNFEGAAKNEQRPKWRPEYTESLRGAQVIVIADRDEPGYAHARAVTRALTGVAKAVVAMTVKPDFKGADLSDHLDAGHGLEDLVPIPSTSPTEEPTRSDTIPDPVPLTTRRTAAPFPVDVLPDWLAAWVRGESTATQTPADLAACCALGVLAACVGGRAVVQARPGWTEPTNLYLLPVLAPASRKSAVIAAATAPLYEAEEELAGVVRGQIVEATTLRDVASKAAQRALQNAANATPDKRDQLTAEAVTAASSAEAITVPRIPRLVADDVTPEAVGTLLAEHDGKLAIISAEGGLFDTMAGRYSQGVPSLDVWLKGHAGDQLRVDRKGRAAEYVKRPALTLLLTVQPAVLSAIAGNGAFRGRGLLARFLFTIPADNVGHRLVGAPPLDQAVADDYATRVRALVSEFADWTDPAVLQLDAPAQELLLDLERDLEPRLARAGDLGGIREWAGKLAGAVLRIAGLLHIASVPNAFRVPISRDTLAAAAAIGEYFIDHALVAFDLLGDGGASDAEYVLAHLARKKPAEFSIRSLLTALPRGRFSSAEEVAEAVAVLVEHGWVLPKPPPERSGAGRPPSPKYAPHPRLLSAESAQSAESPSQGRDRRKPARGSGSAESPGKSAESEPPALAGQLDGRPGNSADFPSNIADEGRGALTSGNEGSADSADIAEPHCLGCGRTVPPGADSCAACYRAGRVA